jgi:hypothetical protein
MLSLGTLAFATPWVLTALVVLPAIVWLLRVTPPSPRRLRFPAIELLRGLTAREETPARTPWWLLLLRLITALAVILALASPLLNPHAALTGNGPIVLVVDNGWAAARDWPARRAAMEELVARAERVKRPIVLLPTAAAPGADGVAASVPLPAVEARRLVQAMEPLPWPADRKGALAALRAFDIKQPALGVWIADGLDSPDAAPLAQALQRLGAAEVLSEGTGARPVHLLLPPSGEGKTLSARVRRDATGAGEAVSVRMTAADGRLLARETVGFPAADTVRDVTFDVPAELRNEAAALRIEGETTAGATVLLDERWRRRPVGLVSDRAEGGDQPLLSDLHYLSRALEPYNEVRRGSLNDLLAGDPAVLILPDVGGLTAEEQDAADRWIRRGGLLLRFAGPHLTSVIDQLVPVRLRFGDRALGGAMSWTDPAKLQPFDAKSPFFGLTVPNDVAIRRQVLSEPSLDLADRTWARLADGTPLVTWERRGDGRLVLVHTTAGPEWSNLALSGLYVDMLRRLVALSAGVPGDGAGGPLDPLDTLDGYGRLGPAPATALPFQAADGPNPRAGPRHPPGFYGREDARRAVNLSPQIASVAPLGALPSGVVRRDFADRPEIALGPGLLALALALIAADLLVSLVLRGLLTRRRAAAAMLALAVLAGMPHRTEAAEPPPGSPERVTATTHLAYVRTGDAVLDTTSRAGLTGLADALARRTAVEPGVAEPIDVETDELAFYPLLYWPVSTAQAMPSDKAKTRLNVYMRNGGVILFDTRDQNGSLVSGEGSAALKALTEGLDVPPLAPVTPDHVLTRSFYLLSEFPGRTTGGEVWVAAKEAAANDGVSPVIVGGHDWAAAWAIDRQGNPMHAVVPGGERQREMAYRFGINLVMYVLTGNYKADQVHVPAILERLGQ